MLSLNRQRFLARLAGPGVLIGAILASAVIGAIMLVALGVNPWTGYKALVEGAFGGTKDLANSALKAMPLLLVGVGITIAFRAGVINIGGEGQIIAGALVATMTVLALPEIPRIVLVPLAIVVGAIGGAIWGGLAGALKSYAGVNEILSTIMLNILAVQIMNLLLRGPLMDPGEIERGSRIPQTERLTDNADLPILPGGTRLHLGVVIAVIMAVVCYFLLFRTTQGLRLRAVGHNPFASRYAGMSVKRNVVLAFMYSGAMCGIAGVTLVFGSEGHRLATDGGATTFTGAAGFNGIVAALFGGLHPLWTIPASFLFGSLLVGANAMQRAVQVPAALILALNGLVVVFVVGSMQARARLAMAASRLRADGTEPPPAPSEPEPGPAGDAPP